MIVRGSFAFLLAACMIPTEPDLGVGMTVSCETHCAETSNTTPLRDVLMNAMLKVREDFRRNSSHSPVHQ